MSSDPLSPYRLHSSPPLSRSSSFQFSRSLCSNLFRSLDARSISAFIRASIALTGGVISWLSLWYILETEIIETSQTRNILFTLAGIALMIATKSLGGQAGLGRIYFQPSDRHRGVWSIFYSFVGFFCDQTVEAQEIEEILRRKRESRIETNIRIVFNNLVSLVAFGAGVLFWVGNYVLVDQYWWPDNPLYKHYSLFAAGLVGMCLVGSISIESGIWGENDVVARSLWDVILYQIRCLVSLQFQVLYWIGLDHLFEQDMFPPTAWRHAGYLIGGFILVSLVNTAGGMSGADEVEDETLVEEEDKQFEKQVETRQRIRAQTIAAAAAPLADAELEQKPNILRHSVEGYFEDDKVNQPSESEAAPEDPPVVLTEASLPIPDSTEEADDQPEASITWKQRFYRTVRLFLSLLGGTLLWEGFESALITHRIFRYANDDAMSSAGSDMFNSTDSGSSDDAPQIDDGTARYHNTLWKLLVMLFAGWFGLIITGTFYANAGVVGPLNVSRGRSAAYREHHRQHIARILSSFRLGPESDLAVDKIENDIRTQRGSLNLDSNVNQLQRRSAPSSAAPSQRSSFTDRIHIDLRDLAHGDF